jgi:hypothetical protein
MFAQVCAVGTPAAAGVGGNQGGCVLMYSTHLNNIVLSNSQSSMFAAGAWQLLVLAVAKAVRYVRGSNDIPAHVPVLG